MVEYWPARTINGMIFPEINIVRCDTCLDNIIEGDEEEAHKKGWKEVDHGIECPECTKVVAERNERDEQEGAVDVVGEFELTNALIGKGRHIDVFKEKE